MPKDPVCGMEIEKSTAAATLAYGGDTYYFCAPACLRQFAKEPNKYLADQSVGAKKKPDIIAQSRHDQGGNH